MKYGPHTFLNSIKDTHTHQKKPKKKIEKPSLLPSFKFDSEVSSTNLIPFYRKTILLIIHPPMQIANTNFHSLSFNMANDGEKTVRKPRFLCLHGFRTSGEIMKKQIHKWPQSVLDKLDLVFVDAPFPCQGKSDVEGIFDPPYYEWFQFNKEFTEYTNFDECLQYIEDCIVKHGPFDGLLGFSQGAILSAALPGLQEKGVALKKVPKVKFLIIISGGKMKAPSVVEKAYSSPITCPSLHFLGETDFLKQYAKELSESCVDPMVIHHPKGHTVPRLDDKSLTTMMNFIERIQKDISENKFSQ